MGHAMIEDRRGVRPWHVLYVHMYGTMVQGMPSPAAVECLPYCNSTSPLLPSMRQVKQQIIVQLIPRTRISSGLWPRRAPLRIF